MHQLSAQPDMTTNNRHFAPQEPAALTAADLADFTDWDQQVLSDLNQQELAQFIMDDDTDAGGWLTN